MSTKWNYITDVGSIRPCSPVSLIIRQTIISPIHHGGDAACPLFCLSMQCFCGIDSDDPKELGNAICNYDCAGDASETCGGRKAISVYQYLDGLEKPPTKYLGCWGDSKRGRIMGLAFSDSSMTNDVSQQCFAWHLLRTELAA